MNTMDFIIILLLIGGLVLGYRKGLIKEMISLVGVLLALFVAYQFSSDLAPALKGVIPLPQEVSDNGLVKLLPIERTIYYALAFLLLFLGTKLMLSIVAALLTRMTQFPVLRQINGVGGALIGFLKVLLLVVIAVHLLQILPWENGQEAVDGSLISQGFLELTPDFFK
ncbi:CvpA family protein [Melghirimyces algeriensis]|uniref:Uncharacterized membrane protein, required for colicin V production n=1 Tax=Melghirimyces algeriensis TaxID=910412 RepID=A0A521AKR7_9BACL|nr:CvpA family protein [Melghirimyces algeriensis]SMO35409.1 Uncharacterized membrane protein, required for colicin V production [Melghirimyces algeriensis]